MGKLDPFKVGVSKLAGLAGMKERFKSYSTRDWKNMAKNFIQKGKMAIVVTMAFLFLMGGFTKKVHADKLIPPKYIEHYKKDGGAWLQFPDGSLVLQHGGKLA